MPSKQKTQSGCQDAMITLAGRMPLYASSARIRPGIGSRPVRVRFAAQRLMRTFAVTGSPPFRVLTVTRAVSGPLERRRRSERSFTPEACSLTVRVVDCLQAHDPGELDRRRERDRSLRT